MHACIHMHACMYICMYVSTYTYNPQRAKVRVALQRMMNAGLSKGLASLKLNAQIKKAARDRALARRRQEEEKAEKAEDTDQGQEHCVIHYDHVFVYVSICLCFISER